MSTDPNKTVFISYRRAVSRHLARSIYMDLTHNGYDVFLDVSTIDNGAFDSVILNQIGARAHFVVLLSAGALERCKNADDWLRREIEEALSLKRNIVPIIEEGFNFESETAYLPDEWRATFKRINGIRLFHDFFDEAMERLRGRYLKQPDFPVEIKRVSKQEQVEVEQRKAQLITPPPPKIETPPPQKIITPQKAVFTPPIPDFLPQPFDWCFVPAGKVRIGYGYWKDNQYIVERTQDFDVLAFFMAKYPLTNAQYQVFVDAKDGYADANWWSYSDDAKAWRKGNPQPQNTGFTGDTHPRTNITWYESVAFMLWMSQKMKLNIHLPTEQQWQRAAIGDTGWAYPYGNEFHKSKCNFHSKGTTPVTQYPNGASPYGVMDMSGNVWEWCTTQWIQGNIPLEEASDSRYYVLRGGSWRNLDANFLRAVVCFIINPGNWFNDRGVRFACSQ